MKKSVFTALPLLAITSALGQGKFFTRDGKVHFLSQTPSETIEAFSSNSSFVLDTKTGDMGMNVVITGFKFEKALMQEHFNENYLESSKYPKATFKGKIDNLSEVNFKKDGEYNASISGNLTMHGVMKDIKTSATISIRGQSVGAKTKFNVKCEDYNIDIPSIIRDRIAKEIVIDIDLSLKSLSE